MRCPRTNKVRHSNKNKARKAKRQVGNAGLEEYFCHACGGWHLGNSHKPWLQQARIDQLLDGLKKAAPAKPSAIDAIEAAITDIKRHRDDGSPTPPA
jgi:hypothetical protein